MRRRAFGFAVAVGLAAGAPAQAPADVRAFVEVDVGAERAFVHEGVELVVRFGVDAAWFAAHALPLFQRRLDRPFQLTVPWLRGADDRAVTPLPPPTGAATEQIAVGDDVVAAARAPARTVDGRGFDVFELRYRWLPLAAGHSTIAPVELRYAWTSAFEDDFLRGRQPVDRRDSAVLSAVHALTVRALPVAGRPAGFTGAVGEFTVRARTASERVRVGETFVVELAIDGGGNLDRIAPPPPPELPGFHVQGLRALPAARGAGFVLDVLALRAGVDALPGLPFAAFSPRTGRYVVHRTQPVPLRIEPLPDGATLPPDVRALVDADAARAPRRSWWRALGFGLATAAALLFVRHRLRRRAGAVPQALARLEAVAGQPAAALDALAALCAVRAGVDRAAADGDAVWPLLRARGVDDAVLQRARVLRADLDAARFGGVPPPRDEVVAVARALATA